MLKSISGAAAVHHYKQMNEMLSAAFDSINFQFFFFRFSSLVWRHIFGDFSSRVPSWISDPDLGTLTLYIQIILICVLADPFVARAFANAHAIHLHLNTARKIHLRCDAKLMFILFSLVIAIDYTFFRFRCFCFIDEEVEKNAHTKQTNRRKKIVYNF